MVETPAQPHPTIPDRRTRLPRMPRWSLPVLLAAGDGYMARNQRQRIFGTGPVTSAGPLVVNWPSGRVDTFEELPVDCELMLAEDHQPMRVPR